MAEPVEIAVVYQDEDSLVLSKPAGMLVHPIRRAGGLTNSQSTVVGWLLEHFPEVREVGDLSTSPSTLSSGRSDRFGSEPQPIGSEDPSGSERRGASEESSDSMRPKGSGQAIERPGIVHRLDRDTSGVLLVARTQAAFEYLKGLFQRHEVRKTYLALVYGKLGGSGVIDTPIGLRSGTVRRSVRAKDMKMVRPAVTEYQTLQTFQKNGEPFSLVRLVPKTGRTHQLRVHLASIGHPVVGDQLYGRRKDPLGVGRQFLHAASLEFTTRAGERVLVEAGMPSDLRRVLNLLAP